MMQTELGPATTTPAGAGGRRRGGRRRHLPAVLLAVTCILTALGATPAEADVGDIGYEGRSHAGTSSPLGTKRAESALWWNDGSWWANMWDTGSADFHIFRLDQATQVWQDTGVPLDRRSNTHADALWDGTHLYVASHVHSTTATSGYPSYLYRLTYDSSTRRYVHDPGFPAQINNYKTDALVIDKDSTGKIWATWIQGSKVYVNRTTGGDLTWGTPFVLPVAGIDVTSVDLSAVVAFGGDKIGVMWSNQTSANTGMYFAVHADDQPDTTWQPSERAVQGAESADDHINLKADSSGRVYAAVKSSYDPPSAPEVSLLIRDPAGAWSSHVFGTVAECHNRPIVMIDESSQILHMFASGPSPGQACETGGGTLYQKTAPLQAINFPSGAGTPVTRDANSPAIHNASSTKQLVNGTTGIVTLTVNTSTSVYWHHSEGPTSPATPTADFTASPTIGPAPLTVQFTDLSSGGPTSWAWDFGDGATSSVANPAHSYTTPGTYDLSLTVSNGAGTDTETRVGYVTVSQGAATFEPIADAYLNQSNPTNNYGQAASLRVRTSKKSSYRSYLTFTVSGLAQPPQSARLVLGVTDGSTDGGRLHVVPDSSWRETGLTWNNAPPFSPTPVVSAGAVVAGSTVELDVSAVITGNGTYSFALVSQSNDTASYSSREGAQPPRLILTTS